MRHVAQDRLDAVLGPRGRGIGISPRQRESRSPPDTARSWGKKNQKTPRGGPVRLRLGSCTNIILASLLRHFQSKYTPRGDPLAVASVHTYLKILFLFRVTSAAQMSDTEEKNSTVSDRKPTQIQLWGSFTLLCRRIPGALLLSPKRVTEGGWINHLLGINWRYSLFRQAQA